MHRPYTTFIGIDLGGSRGKSTAVARLKWGGAPDQAVWVEEVATRHRDAGPWCDGTLVDYLGTLGERVAIAVDAPLTVPACIRCHVPVCPGTHACEVPATVWLRTVGEELRGRSMMSDRDRIAAVSASTPTRRGVAPSPAKQPLAPYLHRATEVALHFERDLLPREVLGQATGPVSARATHLRRLLEPHGFHLNQNLLEVSPRGTLQALFGARRARSYKRDADPWNTRAKIIEDLSGSLRFSPASRLSKEEVLRNDHCFDALVSAYTGFLWARDGWQIPPQATAYADDGFIWVPP